MHKPNASILSFVTLFVLGSIGFAGCGSSVDSGGGGSAGQSTGGMNSGGAGGTGGSGGQAGAGGGNGMCSNAPIGRICVRGEVDPSTNQEVLSAGGVVKFQVYPQGCFSSSCTKIHEASCSAMEATGNVVQLNGTFCLEGIPSEGCTADCNGGGFANCELSTLAAGTYTATLGALQITFDVPSNLPLGGVCIGQQF